MINPAPEELIPSLAHEDALVRNYTARLLGLDNEEQVEQYLKSILVQGAAPLRRLAVQTMSDLADEWTILPMEAALGDPDPAVRAQAARALSQVGNADTASFLVAILGDADAGVRGSAAWALARLSAFSSGVGEGIHHSLVQVSGEFPYIGVAGRQFETL